MIECSTLGPCQTVIMKFFAKIVDDLELFLQKKRMNNEGLKQKTILKYCRMEMQHWEAVTPRYSVKMLFLEISQNSQENTSTRVSFLIKLQASGNF